MSLDRGFDAALDVLIADIRLLQPPAGPEFLLGAMALFNDARQWIDSTSEIEEAIDVAMATLSGYSDLLNWQTPPGADEAVLHDPRDFAVSAIERVRSAMAAAPPSQIAREQGID